MAGFLANLRACYGHERVVDVFQNTGMEPRARQLNIGAYVVRRVLPPEQIDDWHRDLTDSITDISITHGSRAVDLRGRRGGPASYRTIQCASGRCTCRYAYEGTARNRVFQTERVAPFQNVCDWLHDAHRVDRKDHFDAVVANIYSRAANQCIEAHTDQTELLGETSDIVSLSMGAAGVFFWRPSPHGQLRGAQSGWRREAQRHQAERDAGLWGCVPLLPGDLFLASGTFQHQLLHGSLSYTDAANVHQVISQWSMCSEALSVLHSAAYQAYFDNSTEDRSVITFRKNANHVPGCPAGPAAPPPPPGPPGPAAPPPQPVPEPQQPLPEPEPV